MINLAEFEEIRCPTCNRPFMLSPVPGKPNMYRFDGCKCNTEEFYLPDVVGAVGFAGGPMFLVRRKTATSS